jgi:hypothetical protein
MRVLTSSESFQANRDYRKSLETVPLKSCEEEVDLWTPWSWLRDPALCLKLMENGINTPKGM